MIRLKGIKKICGETKKYCFGAQYLQLFVDVSTGEAWTTMHWSLGYNSWTVYHDKDILDCGFIVKPKTMQELRETIASAILAREEQYQ